MLWIITADKVAEGDDRNFTGMVRTHSAKRQTEWRQASPDEQAALRQRWLEECETEFRLLDADGNVYYEGVCKGLNDQPEEAAFEPLDWAHAGTGAVTMEYRKKGDTEWQML